MTPGSIADIFCVRHESQTPPHRSTAITNEATQIDHAATRAKLRTYDLESLWYVVHDTQEAMDANPNGHRAGFYADEQHYAHMEISLRTPGNAAELKPSHPGGPTPGPPHQGAER